jgi:hypothetical protein
MNDSASALPPGPRAAVKPAPFGTLPDGRMVETYTLRNRTGTSFTVCTLGATLLQVNTSSRRGEAGSVLSGPASVEEIRKGAASVAGDGLWSAEVRESAPAITLALVRGEGAERSVVTYTLDDKGELSVTAAVDDGRAAPPELAFIWSLAEKKAPTRSGASAPGVFLHDAASGRAVFASGLETQVTATAKPGGTETRVSAPSGTLKAAFEFSIQ